MKIFFLEALYLCILFTLHVYIFAFLSYNIFVNAVIVLEYLMYLPAFLAALIASYQAYLRKGKFVDLFYISLLSFPFIAIIATLKTLVLLKYGLTSYSFLSGNLPYLVLAGFAFALSARELAGTKAVNIFRYFIASIAALIMI